MANLCTPKNVGLIKKFCIARKIVPHYINFMKLAVLSDTHDQGQLIRTAIRHFKNDTNTAEHLILS